MFPIGMGVMLELAAACATSPALSPSLSPTQVSLEPMLVADLGADIFVEDVDAALCQLDSVREFGGQITTIDKDDRGGTERVTVEFRVPHEYTARVADILMYELGEVERIGVYSGDVSVRNARLRRELAELEEVLPNQSGSDMKKTTERIKLLGEMLAFQVERNTFLFVKIHLIEPRQE